MEDTKKKIFLGVVVLLVLGVVLAVSLGADKNQQADVPDGKYDTFALCLGEKGAKFYGAFWCPHCQSQKELFGSSVKLLPYVECSTPDGNAQTRICIENNITGYPTWEFSDGSRVPGQMTLEELSQKTSCPLPVLQ